MSFIVEENEPLDPVDIRLFGANAVMLQANLLADLIE